MHWCKVCCCSWPLCCGPSAEQCSGKKNPHTIFFILSIRPTARYPNAPELDPVAVINPEILWASGMIEKDWEGCLSVPGIRGRVPRPTAIRVRYLDLDGRQVERDFSVFAARVFLHEYNHLEGKAWLDHVEDNRDIVSEREYLRLIAGC